MFLGRLAKELLEKSMKRKGKTCCASEIYVQCINQLNESFRAL